MPEISRRRALGYVAVLAVALVAGGRLVLADQGRGVAPAAPTTGALEAEAPEPRTLIVHVVGAVRTPGLYELDEGSRIDDAIQRAGGATPQAALELVNLASPVADGQQVLVPLASGENGAATPAAPGGTVVPGRVHLNTATLEELDALPGIGPVTAQKILDYRAENGAFSSIDELDAVPGIGPARLEQLRELVDL